MSKCNSGGVLNKTTGSVTFDSATGLATFSNLAISSNGMYILLISVQTVSSSDYSFECISKPILVKSSSIQVLTSTSTEPDIYLTFSGNYSSKTAAELKQYEAMIYNCMLAKYGLVLGSSIVLYSGSIKAVITTSGTSTGYSTLVSDLNSSNFSLSSDVILQSGIIAGSNYTFARSSGSSGGSSSAEIEMTNAVRFILKQYYILKILN